MKKSLLILLAIIFAVNLNTQAHDFTAVYNGDTIYYNITSSINPLTVEVTNEGFVSYYGNNYSSNDYSGLISIPDSVFYSGNYYKVTSIGNHAFSDCIGLTSVTIPNSVISIGKGAFQDCYGLMSINIPNSVIYIGENAFHNTPYYNNMPDGIVYINNVLYKYKGIMPANTSIYIQGVSISESAFYNCSGLTSLILSDNLTSIGGQAFMNCSGLTQIYFGNNLTTIGYLAFSGCNGITSILLPGNVNSIGWGAFQNCNSLTSITLPRSLTSISQQAFSNCSTLSSINILGDITSIGNDAFNNTPYFNNKPDGLVYIKNILYKYKGIMPANTSINILDGTISISGNAFYNCNGLTSVIIPKSVTSIGWAAFYHCNFLNTVYFNPINCTLMGNSAVYSFSGCDNLSELIIGDSVTNIPSYAFASCIGLNSITIPNSVISIENFAFGYNNLTSIACHANIPPLIGNNTFYNVDKTIPIYVPCNSIPLYQSSPYWNEFTNFIIPQYKDTIYATILKGQTYNHNGFNENSSGIYVDTLQTINGCDSIVTIYLSVVDTFSVVNNDGDTIYYKITSSSSPQNVEVTYKGSSYYSHIEYSGNVSIPDSVYYNNMYYKVTTIGYSAFANCNGLTSISIPNSVTSIGSSAFYYCSGLTSISIPNSVTSIGSYAFYNCSGLSSISIPNSVTSISGFAFYGCTVLTSITIPNSVTLIGSRAFSYCTGLTSIISNAITPPIISSNTFYNVNKSIPLYIPCMSMSLYQSNSSWDEFTNKIGKKTPLFFDTSICKGVAFYNFEADINSGVYTYVNGCDSLILNLTVHPNYNDTIYATICQGETYTLNGFNESTAGFYTQNLFTTKGCDSTVDLSLKVNPIYNDTIIAEICQGDVYTLNGFSASTAGMHTLNLQTYKGCDSTVNLSIKVNPIYNDTIIAEICQGEIYTLNGFNKNVAGFYTQNLFTTKGCDSTVNLSIKVNPIYNIEYYDTIREGIHYSKNGLDLMPDVSRQYIFNYQTEKGCDSIIVLNLEVLGPRILYVSTNGNDSLGNGTETNPYRNIQYAVNQSISNDTIIIKPGVYYESIAIDNNKNIVLGSEYILDLDTNHINNTIIDGSNFFGPGALITGHTSLIKGLSVKNTVTQVISANNFTVSYCYFENNGIVTIYGTFCVGNKIEFCKFINNRGKYVIYSTKKICNSLFRNNGYSYSPDPNNTIIYRDSSIPTMVIERCYFENNYITCFDCIGNYGGEINIINNTFINNNVKGLHLGSWGGEYYYITNNIIENNNPNLGFSQIGGSNLIFRNNFIDTAIPNYLNLQDLNNITIGESGLDSIDNNGYKHLSNSSRLIGAGMHTNSTKDFLGNISPNPLVSFPDLGAIESPLALPITEVTPINDLCLNTEPIVLKNIKPYGGVYSGNGITNDSVFNPSIAGLGTHKIVYTFTNLNSQIIKDSFNIKVNPTYSITINDTICQGETYNSNGFNVSLTGSYTRNLFSIDGCDSVINLNLFINPIYIDTIFEEICYGETYSQFGFNESTTGFYTQYLQTLKGCDSIVNLSLNVNPIYNDTIIAEICQGETYTLNGFNESATGFYTQNLQTTKGCDSIINLSLLANPIYSDTIIAEICQGETYTLNGFNESATGFYTQNLQTTKGCDSIINLSLLANPIYRDTIIAEICQGETYTLNGFNESVEGFYTQNLQTTKGCDSIVNLNLFVNPIYNDTIFAQICQEETYNQFGFNENTTGFYTQNLQTIKGCDSIVNLSLIVNPIYSINHIDTICEGVLYNNYGFNFIAITTRLYTQALQTIKGCDSIVNLSLFVNPIYNDTIIAEICQGETYTLNGFNENTTGFYTQNLQTIKGCDSIINLSLLINPIYNDTIIAEICQGETYTLNGFNESVEGFYTQNLQTTKGCDSIVNLNLFVNPIYNDTIFAQICQEETYNQFGFNENTTGFYTQNLQTIKGCDSIVNLNLLVNPIYNDTIIAEICQGETYTINGFNESVAGFYTQNLQTTKGCDSIVNLSLFENPIYKDTIIAEICQGETYTLNGFNENSTGFYTNSLLSIKGCDSIVNLSLVVNPIYNDTIIAVICNGQTYSQFGFNENTTGFYTQNLQTIEGCDSIVNLNLTVNPTPNIPSNLAIDQMPNYFELTWQGNGNKYDIYRDDSLIANVSQPIYLDHDLVNGQPYCYKVKAFIGDCESDFSNLVCKSYVGLDNIQTNNITTKLYPNPSDGKAKLEVEGLNSQADVLVYDMLGRVVLSYKINQGEKVLDMDLSSFAKGVYTISIVNNVINHTKKLIIQ